MSGFPLSLSLFALKSEELGAECAEKLPFGLFLGVFQRMNQPSYSINTTHAVGRDTEQSGVDA